MAKMNESVDISEIPTDNQNSKVHESLTETGTMSYTKAYEKILRERELLEKDATLASLRDQLKAAK